MKKLLYSLLLFSSATLFAQKNPAVKFAVSDNIVGTVAMFDAKKDAVQSVKVFKTKANLPQNLKKFDYLADNGLAEVKIKNEYGSLDRLSLAKYNLQSGLPEDTPVFIEGYEFKDTSVAIFSEIIEDLKIETVEGKKVVVITTFKK